MLCRKRHWQYLHAIGTYPYLAFFPAGSTVENFIGELGFDRDKLRIGFGETHDIQYSIQGTFELPSKILTLVGRLK
jgi:hypothetical protein